MALTGFAVVCCLVLGMAVHLPGVKGTTPAPFQVEPDDTNEMSLPMSSPSKRKLSIWMQQLQEIQTMKADLRSTKRRLQDVETQLYSTKAKLQHEVDLNKADLQTVKSNLQAAPQGTSGGGSTFVRWGRTQCTQNSKLVYAGLAGGSPYNQYGGGANTLCLTESPSFDNTVKPSYHAMLYGAEYEYIHHHHNQDVPCAVCLVPKSTTIMMPATVTCPAGWSQQYQGHLVAGYCGHQSASEFVCLDGNPEDRPGGQANSVGRLFYFTVAVCGSLPCPPYIKNRVITCVVCSK